MRFFGEHENTGNQGHSDSEKLNLNNETGKMLEIHGNVYSLVDNTTYPHSTVAMVTASQLEGNAFLTGLYSFDPGKRQAKKLIQEVKQALPGSSLVALSARQNYGFYQKVGFRAVSYAELKNYIRDDNLRSQFLFDGDTPITESMIDDEEYAIFVF